MTNAYCDLATLKSGGALNIKGSVYDGRLLALLEDASRQIDDHCNRHFYVFRAARQFEANGWSAGLQQLLVPDLVKVESVRVADRFDGQAGEPRWRSAAHRLYPLDAAPERSWGRPYTRMAIGPFGTVRQRGADCRALVEIAGLWGYRRVSGSTGVTLAANVATGDTSIRVSDGAPLSPGQTLALGDEQVYVTAVDGAQLTVERGVNGAEAADHANGAPVRVYRYPGPVVEACLLLAAQLWHARDRAGVAGETSRGGAATVTGLGREVEALLSAYRKLAI